jgi:putative heme iron utilization protein
MIKIRHEGVIAVFGEAHAEFIDMRVWAEGAMNDNHAATQRAGWAHVLDAHVAAFGGQIDALNMGRHAAILPSNFC